MPAPPVLYWKMSTGIILTSLLMESEAVDRRQRKHRAYFRRTVPVGADAWGTSEHGPWLPVAELPPEIAKLLDRAGEVRMTEAQALEKHGYTQAADDKDDQ